MEKGLVEVIFWSAGAIFDNLWRTNRVFFFVLKEDEKRIMGQLPNLIKHIKTTQKTRRWASVHTD